MADKPHKKRMEWSITDKGKMKVTLSGDRRWQIHHIRKAGERVSEAASRGGVNMQSVLGCPLVYNDYNGICMLVNFQSFD